MNQTKHDWLMAVACRDQFYALASRLEYALINDRLSKTTAKMTCDLLADMQRIAKDSDIVVQELSVRMKAGDL